MKRFAALFLATSALMLFGACKITAGTGGSTCGTLGSFCQIDADCCNGLCDGGVCAKAIPACLDETVQCLGDGECCSGICNMADGLCGCVDPGFACTDDIECCGGGICDAGTCAVVLACIPDNDPTQCGSDADCCTTCNPVDHVCGCVDIGFACADDVDCCNGICDGTQCVTATCLDEDVQCFGDNECCSGICNTADGLCGCVVSGGLCNDNFDCCDGYYCASDGICDPF